MKQVFNFAVLAAVCVLGFAGTASSQSLITWEASEQMYSGATDQAFVNTNGTLIYAANMDSRLEQNATITLNGVVFNTTNLAGLATLTGTGGVTMATTMPDETGASYGDGSFNADGDIFNVIATGMFSVGDVTFSGLTPGQTYEIQIFVNDSRNGRHANYVCALSDGVNAITPANASFCKHSNRDPLDAAVGEASGDSITGSFVAGAAGTQTFSVDGSTDGGVSFNSAGRAQINAIQLRDVTSVSTVLLGDVDLSGDVDFLDISPFIGVLSAGGTQAEADCNEDGAVDFLDISPFIAILSGS